MDQIVTCPYEQTHRISTSKLQYHLFRCKRSNFSVTKVCCPFDALHIIDEEYFERHVVNCASSGNVRNHLYSLELPKQLGTVSLKAATKLTVPIMEDWIEEDVETYDPWKNTEKRYIIRSKSGGTKSQRKHFKLTERKRLSSLKKESPFKLHRTTCFKRNPLKEYSNASELVRSLRRMCLLDFDALLESADLSNLHISKKNKFSEYKCMSQIAEGILTQKLKELVLHCMKKKIS